MQNPTRSLRTKILSAALFAFGVGTCSWVASEGNAANTFAFRKTVQEVRVAFSVEGAQRSLFTPLNSSDVSVFDDGRPVSSITTFQHESSTPLDLVLLVDASDSMQKELAGERRAAREALNILVRPGIDSAEVVDFAARAIPNDAHTILKPITHSRDVKGQTALYDTMYAVTENFGKASRDRSVRRMILLFSDGEDNWSRHNLDDVVSIAQKTDTSTFTVTVHSHRLEFPGDAVLEHLSDSTGGRFFLLNDFNAIGRVLETIKNRSYYTLAFRRTNPLETGDYHSLKIESRRRNLKIRCRSGYYTDPLPAINESQ